jgi:hypothetical protein
MLQLRRKPWSTAQICHWERKIRALIDVLLFDVNFVSRWEKKESINSPLNMCLYRSTPSGANHAPI